MSNHLVEDLVNEFYSVKQNPIVKRLVEQFYQVFEDDVIDNDVNSENINDAVDDVQQTSEPDENESLLDKIVNGEDKEINNLLRTNTPIIYAFITEHVPDMIKIGFTDQGALTRLKQWQSYYPDAKMLGYWTSMEFNSANKRVFFKDFPVHKRTVAKGYKQITDDEKENFRNLAINDNLKDAHISREFFHKYKDINADEAEELSEQIIEDIVKELKNDIKNDKTIDIDLYELLDNGTTRKADRKMPPPMNYELTDLQKKCIENGVNAIKAGKQDLLMACVMRFGKTTSAYHIIKEAGIKYAAVTSAKADTRQSWRNDINHVNLYKDFAFVEFDGKFNYIVSQYDKTQDAVITASYQDPDTIQHLRDAGKTVIVYATLADLKGEYANVSDEINVEGQPTQKIRVIKDKHKYLFDHSNGLELVVIDESHFGSHSKMQGTAVGLDGQSDDKSSEAENTEHVKLMNQMHKMTVPGKTIRLQCSGTPYYILKNGEFAAEYTNKEIIADVSYSDMLNARDKWLEDHPDMPEYKSPYFGIPNLIRFGMNLTKECRKVIATQKSFEIGLNELFRLSGKEFIHEKAIIELMESIFGSHGKNMPGFLDNDRIKNGEIFKHIMFVMPTVDACHVLRNLLVEKNIIDVNKIKPIVVVERREQNGWKYDPEGKDSDTLNAEMDRLEKEGKRSLTFTVVKMLTGVTLKYLDAMFFFKGSKSPQEYDQAIFRLCSRNVADVKEPDGTVSQICRKNNVYLIDFAIDRMFNMCVDSAISQCASKGISTPKEIADVMAENIKNMPMYTESIFDKNTNKILNNIQEVHPNDLLKLYAKYNRDKSIEESIKDGIKSNKFGTFLNNTDNINLIKQFTLEGLSSNNIDSKSEEDKGNETNVNFDGGDNGGIDGDTIKDKGKGNKDKKNTALLNEMKGKFMNMLKRILYSSICLDESVRDITTYIKLMRTVPLVKEITNEFMLDADNIEMVYNSLSLQEQLNINMLLVQLDELKNDPSLKPIDRVMNSVRKLGKMDDSEVVTPQNLCNKMINKLDDNIIKNAKSILLINEKYGEFLIALYNKFGKNIANKCQIVPSSKIGKRLCMKMVQTLGLDMKNILNIADYNKKIPGYDIQDWLLKPNDLILKEDNNDMKYDLIIANPPFKLGEKMLTKWFDIADGEIITVQPTTWLTGKKKTKSICSHLDSGEFTADIESINGAEYFDAGIGGLISIQHFKKNSDYNRHYVKFDGKEYDKTDEISLTSNDELLTNFKTIISPLYLLDNLNNHIYKTRDDYNTGFNDAKLLNEYNYYVLQIATIRGNKDKSGNGYKDDFYTIISNDKNEINKKLGLFNNIIDINLQQFYFKNKNLTFLINLINYIKTDFCRAALYIVKNTIQLGRGELKYVPWFDFNEPVFSKSPSEIDDYLFAKYNISDEIRKHIEELLPDYYNIRKGQD
ncbi:MAG: hypothetical protein [Wendovervirus sonii]|uniref:Site-specific DNA-methyltransferase (adenine-specific) n=1 Tax=phage Lak_Megaphage_Sonny TaxID=3109229 RepID=A0ABZ0Z415_9CAUD|nr:MAG: hypothetical protein [phage Lak_Megaphage_Sonny]